MDEFNGPNLRLFGWVTVAYLGVIVVLANVLGYIDFSTEPIAANEQGDVLAGVFSPLAFWWLLYASLSQRTQLSIQRREIKNAIDARIREEEQLRREQQVWMYWYLNGLSELHDQIINYTAHLAREISPRTPLQTSREDYFQISHLQGVLHAEIGLAKVHLFPPTIQARIIELLSRIRKAHRSVLDYQYRVREKGVVSADDIKSFCHMLNQLANVSWHVALDGREMLAQREDDAK